MVIIRYKISLLLLILPEWCLTLNLQEFLHQCQMLFLIIKNISKPSKQKKQMQLSLISTRDIKYFYALGR